MAWRDDDVDTAVGELVGAPKVAFRVWEVALDLFAAHCRPDGCDYVAAALPTLPFSDGQFSLTMSGYLLFAYPGLLSFETHLAGIRELVRVTRGEVRIHSLIDADFRPYPWMAALRQRLAQSGVETEQGPAQGAYQPGGTHMLVCHRTQAK